MTTFRISATFPTDTSLPADYITNTWHFEGDSSEVDNAVDMLEDFYTSTPTGDSTSIVGSMPSDIVGTQLIFKAYALEEPEPRVPSYERTVSISPSASPGLPSEVALCFSFQAERESGENQARRRNRVYIGPLTTSQNTTNRPTSAIRTRLARAGRDLLQASDASLNMKWVGYSPAAASAGGSPAAGTWDVNNGWIDDAWDTQRRRGYAATTRTTWTDATP